VTVPVASEKAVMTSVPCGLTYHSACVCHSAFVIVFGGVNKSKATIGETYALDLSKSICTYYGITILS
jgi:N-acetylneuraminic acid mutarotase